MKSYNILILSVGRRVELVNCFKSAANSLEIKNIIVGADCQTTAPALYFTDNMCILPKISSDEYIDSIINACNRYNIALIIPTIDTDLMLLAKNRENIENHTNAKVLISDEEVIRICRDKRNTQDFLESNGFIAPYLYSEDELSDPEALTYPLFIKPADGSSSINAYKVNNAEDLKAYKKLIPNLLIQEHIDGDEYTIDTFLDFNSNIITIVPRLRIATRSGEISKGRIVRDREIINKVKRLLKALKPIGHITIQCIKTNKSIVFIEINPRFGGGAPMSIKAGADSCENLYRLLRGEGLKYNEDYEENMMFLRFDNSICLNEDMEVVGTTICSNCLKG
jgi:carbamoyl-phosphate synthase large subunit